MRKVALEEPPGNRAFGACEGNWNFYNVVHDVALPGSTGPELGFLMYPQAQLTGMART